MPILLARRLGLLLALALVPTPSPALDLGEGEVGLRFIATPQGSRVVMEFSSRPDYQVRQESGRVVVSLQGSFRSVPYKQKSFDDLVLEHFKIDRGYRQTDLIFKTGPEFASISSFEMSAPFRLVLDLLHRTTAVPGAPPPSAGAPVPPLPGAPPGARPLLQPAPQTSPPPAPGVPIPTKGAGIQTIVVDAGHGGSESGARGPTGLLEKDITLDVAKRLQTDLQRRLGVNVILTRETDRQVGLDDRTALANHNRADLFISVHVNASQAKDVRGAETYFLSYRATDDEARTVAALENNTVGVETPPGNTNLELVLWDLAQSQYLSESSQLAETIQQNLNELLRIESRGVKQAPFKVLMGATMPAVLVEVGFITNAEEETRLRDGAYREKIAAAIADSIATFKETTEKRLGLR